MEISKLLEKPPMYWEAREYCEEFDLPPEDLERVRCMLTTREFNRRIKPYLEHGVKILSGVQGFIQDGQGYMRANLTLEQDRAVKQLQELIDAEAKNLGLAGAEGLI